ncbi:hypothetical protein Bca4012_053046 [Brassica carinata]
MAAIFDSVIELNPAKTSWKIKVKIICVMQGDTIHATVNVNEDVLPIFESFLEEGDSRIFINFKISEAISP